MPHGCAVPRSGRVGCRKQRAEERALSDAWRALDGRTNRGRARTASGSGAPRGARSVGAIPRRARGRGEAAGPDPGRVTPGLLDIGEHLGRPSITRPKGRSGRVKRGTHGCAGARHGVAMVPGSRAVPVVPGNWYRPRYWYRYRYQKLSQRARAGASWAGRMGWPSAAELSAIVAQKKKRPRESNPEPWRTAGRLDVSTSKRERAAFGVGAGPTARPRRAEEGRPELAALFPLKKGEASGRLDV